MDTLGYIFLSCSSSWVVWLAGTWVGFQYSLPMKLGMRANTESPLLTDQKPSFGKKLLSCFNFEITTVFTDKDSVNSLAHQMGILG